MLVNLGDPLTPAVFYILLSLKSSPSHGYAIMKKILEDSEGKIKIGPGTLYVTIDKLLKLGLIQEYKKIIKPQNNKEALRKYYCLTGLGEKALSAELARFARALEVNSAYVS